MLEKLLSKNTVKALVIATGMYASACNFDPVKAYRAPDASYDAKINLDAGVVDVSGQDVFMEDVYTLDTGFEDVSTSTVSDGAVEDADIPDSYGRDAESADVYDASIPDAGPVSDCVSNLGAPQVNGGPDLVLQVGVDYCVVFIPTSTRTGEMLPAGCGNIIPYAPGHSENGTGSVIDCAATLDEVVFERDINTSTSSYRQRDVLYNKGAFNFRYDRPGNFTGAVIMFDSQRRAGQDTLQIQVNN